jgi:hypothetical protein
MSASAVFNVLPNPHVLTIIALELEICTEAGAVNSRGKPAGAGEKNFQVPREGREREILEQEAQLSQ